MLARTAAKRILQAVFVIVAIAGAAGAASAPLGGIVVFLVGGAGFVATSYLVKS